MVGEDAFTHSRALDMHRPLHTVALGDADDTVVYVSNATGEVVRDATARNACGTTQAHGSTGSTLPGQHVRQVLDGHRELAVHRWRRAGAHGHRGGRAALAFHRATLQKSGSRSPYPGGMMKRHHTTGLLFAAVTITWVFSGLMSMNPWKLFDSGAPPLRTAAMHGGPLQLAMGHPGQRAGLVGTGYAQRARAALGARGGPHRCRPEPSGVATLLDATTAAHHAIAPQELTAAARLVDAPVQEVQTLNAYDLHYYDRAPHTMGGGADKPCPCGGWCLPTRMPPGTSTHASGTVLAAPTPTAAPAAGCFPCCTAGTGCPCWSAARCGTWC